MFCSYKQQSTKEDMLQTGNSHLLSSIVSDKSVNFTFCCRRIEEVLESLAHAFSASIHPWKKIWETYMTGMKRA